MSSNFNSSFNNSIEQQMAACASCSCPDPCYCDTPWPLPDVVYAIPKWGHDGYALRSTVDTNNSNRSNQPY